MLASTKQPPPQVEPRSECPAPDFIHLTSPGMSRSGIQLYIELQDGLPLVLADSNQLQQVFLNLIANAADAMPAGGELHVQTALEEAGDNRRDRPSATSMRYVARLHP